MTYLVWKEVSVGADYKNMLVNMQVANVKYVCTLECRWKFS